MTNYTVISEFVLQCMITPSQRTLAIAALVFVYVASLFGNLIVIVVIKINYKLHTPMYVFIGTLAVIDLANSTILIPKMLADLQYETASVPYRACMLQMYVILNMEEMESILLIFMALDRYVAVLYPLRYPSVITMKFVWTVVLFLPVFTFLLNSLFVIFATELSFCHTNILPYCFCDYATMVNVACNDDPKYLSLLTNNTTVFGLVAFALTLFSYARIVLAALKITSSDGKKKAFSTTFTHLLVVGFFHFPLLSSYILPGAGVKMSAQAYNTMVIVGNVVPPMLNPVIYSFRNNEIKNTIYRLFKGKRTVPAALHT
ncbi:olfactory receptor 1E1-like [Erpetoichthys calabaricus]|uniref:olfactory receptor 1E1-like n=1 Tax=Erpetoichthys calabaricus TaxID=27687 RepID=UPI00109F57D3|nr:olfactory receptor 1E1-like [Erpetoichthys calabaricus]XP_039602059.1 olfactory receptor 1E1-like [Polypterus senegalus]